MVEFQGRTANPEGAPRKTAFKTNSPLTKSSGPPHAHTQSFFDPHILATSDNAKTTLPYPPHRPDPSTPPHNENDNYNDNPLLPWDLKHKHKLERASIEHHAQQMQKRKNDRQAYREELSEHKQGVEKYIKCIDAFELQLQKDKAKAETMLAGLECQIKDFREATQTRENSFGSSAVPFTKSTKQGTEWTCRRKSAFSA